MFYQTLNVHRTASSDEIKASYHKLALKMHPDKCGGSHEDFQKIQKAYEILMDAEKRAEYDQIMAKKREKMRNFIRPEPFTNVVKPVSYKLADDKSYMFETAPQKVRCGLRYGDILAFQHVKGCFVGLATDDFLYWCSDGHNYATRLCHAASDFALSSVVVLQRSNLDGGQVHVVVPPKKTTCKNQTPRRDEATDSAPAGEGNRKSRARLMWEQLRRKEMIRLINQYLKDVGDEEMASRKALEAEYLDQLEAINSNIALALQNLKTDVSVKPETCKSPDDDTPFHLAASFAIGIPLTSNDNENDKVFLQSDMSTHSDTLSEPLILNEGSESFTPPSTLQHTQDAQSVPFYFSNRVASMGDVSPQKHCSAPEERFNFEHTLEVSPDHGCATLPRSVLALDEERQKSLPMGTAATILENAPPRRFSSSATTTETECVSIISNEGINGTQCNTDSESEESMFQVHFVAEVPCQNPPKASEARDPDLLRAYDSRNEETTNTTSQPGVSTEPSTQSFSSETVLNMNSPIAASVIEQLRNAAPFRSSMQCYSRISSTNGSKGTALYREGDSNATFDKGMQNWRGPNTIGSSIAVSSDVTAMPTAELIQCPSTATSSPQPCGDCNARTRVDANMHSGSKIYDFASYVHAPLASKGTQKFGYFGVCTAGKEFLPHCSETSDPLLTGQQQGEDVQGRVRNPALNGINGDCAEQLTDLPVPQHHDLPFTAFPQAVVEESREGGGKNTMQRRSKDLAVSKKHLQHTGRTLARRELSLVRLDADGRLIIAAVKDPKQEVAQIKRFNRYTADELYQEELSFIEEFTNQGKNGRRRK